MKKLKLNAVILAGAFLFWAIVFIELGAPFYKVEHWVLCGLFALITWVALHFMTWRNARKSKTP